MKVKRSLVIRPKESYLSSISILELELGIEPDPVFVASGTYEGDRFVSWDEISFVGLRLGDALFFGTAKRTESGWKVEVPFHCVFDDGEEENFNPNIEELCSAAEKGLKFFEKKLRLLANVKDTLETSDLVFGVITSFLEGNTKVKVKHFGKESKVIFQNFPVGSWSMDAKFEKFRKGWYLTYISLKKEIKVQSGTVIKKCYVDSDKDHRYPWNVRERIERLIGSLQRELQTLFESVQVKDFLRAKRIFDRISRHNFNAEGSLTYESYDGKLSVDANDHFGWIRTPETGKTFKDPQIASKLVELIKKVERTGQDDDLRSFCEQILSGVELGVQNLSP